MGTMSHMRPSRDKQVVVPIHNVRWNSKSRLFIQHLAYDRKHINSHVKGNNTLVSCAKTAEPINTSKSGDASSDSTPQGSLEKKPLQAATFPNGFEALVLEVCDETEIAELKVKVIFRLVYPFVQLEVRYFKFSSKDEKENFRECYMVCLFAIHTLKSVAGWVGDFEMHIKRNIGATKVPLSNISPTTPPPIPSKPMDESAPGTLPPSPPKSSPEKKNSFIDSFREKSPRMAALEASGTTTYVLVPSPTVGFFRRGRTVKGKRQPPICKEGDLVKEGQIIGYLDQFGTGLPVKTDVAGQVLKLLVDDGVVVVAGGRWQVAEILVSPLYSRHVLRVNLTNLDS
ncbi:hypothetical protein LR48_Vigan03g301300 [Vigna angularis]|uniref:Lipoyl-binding domain-containing protein n=1 Tax=Phaseolus angularis TaxID=3914 RepID=A0A0L9UAA5_PHAAN|nr:hypothetical protein LR48_Vigan03g301300 [Vigna angularis]